MRWTGAVILGTNCSFPIRISFSGTFIDEGLKVTLATGDALVEGEACRSLDDQLVPDAGRAKSTYTVYEDASQSEAYKHGVCAWTEIDSRQSGRDLEVEIQPVHGDFPGGLNDRGYELRLPGDWPPESVIVDGQRLDFVREAGKPGWRYEGITLTTVVTVPRRPVTSRVEIDIHRQRGLLRLAGPNSTDLPAG